MAARSPPSRRSHSGSASRAAASPNGRKPPVSTTRDPRLRGPALAAARELARRIAPPPPPAQRIGDPARAARLAGLRYANDARPGIRRLGSPKKFRYIDARGRPVRDRETVGRIKRLAIPPAWTDVWINPDPRGHIQARGRDARKRKQYRYHPHWREFRDGTKFAGLVGFARALPQLRRAVMAGLRRATLDRERVIAVVVRLLERSLIRIGNESYARENKSFGLTTLRDQHARIAGRRIKFRFPGKSGIRHEIELHDPSLAKIVRATQDLPGQELFQYLDETGARRRLQSDEVNAFIREHMGDDYTAKDFRTWAATVIAAVELAKRPPPQTKREAKAIAVEAVCAVAKRLGNTPAVCRKSYIHPAIIDGFARGELATLNLPAEVELPQSPRIQLGPAEKTVLAYLRRQHAKR